MQKRQLLGLMAGIALQPAASLLLPRAARAGAELSLLAAGPEGDQISRWADACALALGPGFPGDPTLRTQPTGGLNGVTGANRFDALVAADGSTAGMFPGATMLTWLTGDSRVHYDPPHWVPVMAATNSGVLVARLPAKIAPGPQILAAGGSLRLAVDDPESNDLAALLALQRMNVPLSPIFGLRSREAKTRAFVAGEADAVFLCGEGVPEDIAPLSANGGVPVFSLGRMADDGSLTADPRFPALPDAMTFGSVPADAPLGAAYQAAAAAARLDFLMTLPHLTDPNAVALWQQAASRAITSAALDSAAEASSVDLRAAAGAAAELHALALSRADQEGLQHFLQTRFGWRAS